VSRADASLDASRARGVASAFASKWGEEWEPEEFAVSGNREFEVRSGRSSMVETRGWDW